MVSMLTYQMTPLSRLWWKVWIFITFFFFVNFSNSGFRALSSGLPQDSIDREQLLSLQQLVSTSADGKEAGRESFREQYKRYKESFVKHLRFDPEKPNLSKFLLSKIKLTHLYFRCSYRACSARGSLHFLWHGNLWWDWEGCEGGCFESTYCWWEGF